MPVQPLCLVAICLSGALAGTSVILAQAGDAQPSAGMVTLSAVDRKDLAEGHLIVRFYLHNGRASAADLPVSFRK